MEKKIYKFNEIREALKGIIKKTAVEDFIILIQVNSATAGKSKLIYDYCRTNKLKIKFVNHKKIKMLFKTSKQNAILKKVNNSMLLIQGEDYLKECLKVQEYYKSIGFDKSLIIISIFIRGKDDNVFEYTVEDFKELVQQRENVKAEFYNVLKKQTMFNMIKLINVLKMIKNGNT